MNSASIVAPAASAGVCARAFLALPPRADAAAAAEAGAGGGAVLPADSKNASVAASMAHFAVFRRSMARFSLRADELR